MANKFHCERCGGDWETELQDPKGCRWCGSKLWRDRRRHAPGQGRPRKRVDGENRPRVYVADDQEAVLSGGAAIAVEEEDVLEGLIAAAVPEGLMLVREVARLAGVSVEDVETRALMMAKESRMWGREGGSGGVGKGAAGEKGSACVTVWQRDRILAALRGGEAHEPIALRERVSRATVGIIGRAAGMKREAYVPGFRSPDASFVCEVCHEPGIGPPNSKVHQGECRLEMSRRTAKKSAGRRQARKVAARAAMEA